MQPVFVRRSVRVWPALLPVSVVKLFGRSTAGGVTPAALKAGMASGFGEMLTDDEVTDLIVRLDTDGTASTASARSAQ